MQDFEYRTEKCYPPTETETKVINSLKPWGWERADYNAQQSFERVDSSKFKSSYIKLRRDKNMRSYDEIIKMEMEYNEGFQKTKPVKPEVGASYPSKKFYLHPIVLITLMVAAFMVYWLVSYLIGDKLSIVAVLIIEIAVIIAVLLFDLFEYLTNKKSYETDLKRYNAELAAMPERRSEYNVLMAEYDQKLAEYNDLPNKAAQLIS